MILASDLATLQQVKDYISPDLKTTDDALLQRFIGGASAFIEKDLARSFAVQSYTERRNGTGMPSIAVRHWPIVSVQSVTIGNTQLQAAPLTNGAPSTIGGGYINDERSIYLRPGSFGWGEFPRGMQNILLVYQGGFLTPGIFALAQLPAWTANSPLPQGAQVAPGNGWVFTATVSGTSGATQPVWPMGLANVIADGTLFWSATSPYAGIVSGSQLLAESIQTAATQLVALMYRQRDRVGDTGEGLGPERVNYFMGAMGKTTEALLKRLRDVVPPWEVMP